MMTVGSMSPDGAISYYTQDNYYQQNDAAENSEWWGDGADELGLAGHVDDIQTFENVCRGFSPDKSLKLRQDPVGTKRVKGKDGEWREVPREAIAGTDTTFSAPKSVSLACFVGGDNRLAEAHRESVKATLEIAQRYLSTWVGGKVVQGYKPVVAVFHHDTSRELDPQLHTHAFWMNLCQTSDGKWQSTGDRFFTVHQVLLGQIYRNELAMRCQGLGYEIEERSDGLFELKGYSRGQIEGFSTRHNQILDKLDEMGLPHTTENRIFALFATRKPKQHGIDRGELVDYWQRTAETIGIEHPIPSQSPVDARKDLAKLVGQAINHCEERRSVFTIEAIEKFITSTPTGWSIEDIEWAIVNHPKTIHKDNLLATEWSQEREKLTLALMEQGKGTMPAIGMLNKPTPEAPPDIWEGTEFAQEISDESIKPVALGVSRTAGEIAIPEIVQNQTQLGEDHDYIIRPNIEWGQHYYRDRQDRSDAGIASSPERGIRADAGPTQETARRDRAENVGIDEAAGGQIGHDAVVRIDRQRGGITAGGARGDQYDAGRHPSGIENSSPENAELRRIAEAVLRERQLREIGPTIASIREKLAKLKQLQLEEKYLRAQVAAAFKKKQQSAAGTGLTPAQEAAVLQVLGTHDRTIAWVGVAGAGKTTTINELLNLIDGRVTVRGFAPDASAANTLERETGIKTTTIASLLSDYELQGSLKPGDLLIVDEAGKLSAEEGYRLMTLSKDHDVRVLLVGDPEQLSSVNAGAPFKALIDNGINTAYLKDFLRQKDPTLNRAVQMLYHDHAVDALKLLNGQGCIQEIKDFENRMEAIATDWLKSDRPNTRIVAGTHAERDAITDILRKHLRGEGLIGQKEYSLRVMPGKDMTQEQMQHTRFYAVGDVLVPSLNRAGLKAYKQYHVVDIEGDRITFQQGKIVKTVDLSAIEKPLSGRVYHPKEIRISTGDRLVWTQNNHNVGRVNGKEVTVVGVEGNIVHLRFDDGKRQHIPLNQLNHLDHALVRTIYSSQGMTCDRVLASFGIDQTVCKESILVALTRARWEARFYCSSQSTLYDRVEQSNSQVNILEWLKERGFKVKAPPPPQNIDLKHWVERVEKSAVLPSVAALNVESIKGDEVLRRLLETRLGKKSNAMSGKLKTANVKYWEEKFASVAEGGAWNMGGIDARSLPTLTPGDRPILKAWGEFKPDNPRLNAEKTLKKGEPVYQKYEAPLDEPKGIFLPEVPPEIAEKIFQRYGVNPTPEERASGFWPCVYWYPQIDVQITEGKKKGEASISQGYCCIPLPSIWGGFRSKDENGNLLPHRVLHEELAVFAAPGRNVLIAFDKDSNQKTMETVRGAAVVLGELMEKQGCAAKIVPWKTEQGKGIDDFIVAQGARAWEVQVSKAYPLEWDSEKHHAMQYRKTKASVERSNGNAPTQEMLDVAIAVSVRPEDAPKILSHSPALKDLGIDERVQYMDRVQEQAIALAQKMEAQKNTPHRSVSRGRG